MNIYKSERGKRQVLESYDRILGLWGTEYRELDVPTRWGMTHCIVSGQASKPPLLLFHGVGDNSAAMWFLNVRALAEHFYCIAVDTLGGPGKSVPNSHFTKNQFDQAEWITEIADHFKLGRFHITGVSNGGYMAFQYAVKNPWRIEKVVCMEGGMVTNPVHAMLSMLLLMLPEILLPTRGNMIRIMKKLSSPDSEVFSRYPEWVDHLVLLMKNHNQKAMLVHKIETYNKLQSDHLRDRAYFLLGGSNGRLNSGLNRVLEDDHFQYSVIEGAGHGINQDQPEKVNREIIRFLLAV
jgi:pimeloyl-ACP methyl ester carboxylesterase